MTDDGGRGDGVRALLGDAGAGASESDRTGDLFDGSRRTYTGEDGAAAVPLGGLGTGNVSLGARGDLRDWELFHRPAKGFDLPYSFLALRCAPAGDGPDYDREGGSGDPAGARTAGDDAVLRVLESRLRPPHDGHSGYPPESVAGLPRFERSRLDGRYPVAELALEDPAVPLDVSLTAYTPMVPLDPEASGIPVAVLEYELANPTDRAVEASLAGTLTNPAGAPPEFEAGGHRNRFRDERGDEGGIAGVHFTTEGYDRGDLGYAEAALAVRADGDDEVTHTATWEREGWWDPLRSFVGDFADDGRLEPAGVTGPSPDGHADVGSVATTRTLAPGEATTVTVLLTWYVPNREHEWVGFGGREERGCCGGVAPVEVNYATRFADAWDVAGSVDDRLDGLRAATTAFSAAFHGSTLPGYVKERVAAGMVAARSPTCVWLADGSFVGWEGCRDDAGCCPGTCTHVWNYAWTLARLYPSLERSMRRADFASAGADGRMPFRSPLPAGSEPDLPEREDRPAIDGQMGTVMRTYREWLASGDDEFLAETWPDARRALEYAFEYEEWDPDADGLLTGEQHVTYDFPFHGPNPLGQTWYLGALRAGAAMARAVGEDERADRYEAVADAGAAATDERLWNGAYYEQAVDAGDDGAGAGRHRYQHGPGCLADQLTGAWFARQVGLGTALPDEHVDRALSAILEHNAVRAGDRRNCQRTFALNDERGLVLCSWPRGGEPDYPFVFADEVWTGVEHAVAAHLALADRPRAALAVERAVADRYDGRRRNPWDAIECGHHYARAMSSWAAYEALCGLRVDCTDGGAAVETNDRGVAFDPTAALGDDPRAFWATGDAWGVVEDTSDGEREVTVLYERDGGLTGAATGDRR